MFKKINNLNKILIITISISIIILIGLSALMPMIYNYNMRQAISQNGFISILKIGTSINNYATKYNRMPVADKWGDILIENYPSLKPSDFRIPQYDDIQCVIAYNKHLSNEELKYLSKNIVVLFEADGQMNLTGDANTITNPRIKDTYFNSFLAESKFIYIYFMDTTIAKYRIDNDTISIYDASHKNYLPYTKNSIYLPLKWNP